MLNQVLDHKRRLLPEELSLIEVLIQGCCIEEGRYLEDIRYCFVMDMQDGGMRSIAFAYEDYPRRIFKRSIRTAQYTDDDGVLVLINLDVDEENKLYELDIWKVDFSPLSRYPRPSDLRLMAE